MTRRHGEGATVGSEERRTLGRLVLVVRVALLIACSLSALKSADGQATSSLGAIVGRVFDSVSQVPLGGAVVQAVSRDSSDLRYAAVADSFGHYRIVGVPFGSYTVGFFHRVLDALGLDTPQRFVRVTSASDANIDLAVPSGTVVRALRCGGDSARRDDGMAVGFVDDLGKSMSVFGAVVSVRWRAISTDTPTPTMTAEHRTATIAADGTYLLCGLPVDVPLAVSVTAPHRRPVVGQMTVPAAGARQQDFHMVDSSATTGDATLLGSVARQDGSPVTSGDVVLQELGVGSPIVKGRFRIENIPPGSWAVTARAVGLEPTSLLVNLEARETTSVKIELLDHAQLLEPVAITRKPTRESTILRDVLFRKRFGAGTVFMPGDPWLSAAGQIGDVLRAARGFRVSGSDGAVGRQPCSSNGPILALYVNGEPFRLKLADLNRMIPIGDVLAVEAYPDGAFAPFQWRTDKPCAVIAVWTKRR